MRLRRLLSDLYAEFPGMEPCNHEDEVQGGDLVAWLCDRVAREEDRELEIPHHSDVLNQLAEIEEECELTDDELGATSVAIIAALVRHGAFAPAPVFVGVQALEQEVGQTRDPDVMFKVLEDWRQDGTIAVDMLGLQLLVRLGKSGQVLVGQMLNDHAEAKAVRA